MRILALTAALVLAGSTAVAQEQAAGRYAFAPAEGGALRLDTLTGQVSFCTGAAEASACAPVPGGEAETAGNTAGLEARIAALEAKIAALEAAGPRGNALLPDEETMDRVMVLTERMMRRFFGMVRDMKRDMEGETL